MCPAAAIGLALGYSASAIGVGRFFNIPNRAQREVGSVILRSGLLDDLPVPQPEYRKRRPRPLQMTPSRAVRELARWSDDKTLDSVVVTALRARAGSLTGNSDAERPVGKVPMDERQVAQVPQVGDCRDISPSEHP